MRFKLETTTLPAKRAKEAVIHLMNKSCWFMVTPLPDDQYEIAVKRGEGIFTGMAALGLISESQAKSALEIFWTP